MYRPVGAHDVALTHPTSTPLQVRVHMVFGGNRSLNGRCGAYLGGFEGWRWSMVSGGRVGWVGGLVMAGGGAWCGTNIPHLHPTSGQGIPDFRSKIGASTDVWRHSRQYGRVLMIYGE